MIRIRSNRSETRSRVMVTIRSACPEHDLLEESRDAMTPLLVVQDLPARDPVHLDHPARPDERFVAMPRVVAPPEADQGPLLRRDFDDDVLEVRPRTKEPQAAAGLLPR